MVTDYAALAAPGFSASQTMNPPSQTNLVTDQETTWLLAAGVKGLVSVIIPTFNRADLVKETLESVREQTYRPLEVVVVDDGSVDNTGEVVEKWSIS